MTAPIPAARSRYSGHFVVDDIANNKRYLCDKLFEQQIGHDLTGWTLAGATVPTIAADGQIDLFDNTNLANQRSELYRTIPNTLGGFYGIFHSKFTRQADDNSLDTARFIVSFTQTSGNPLNSGASIRVLAPGGGSLCRWMEQAGGGTSIAVAWEPSVGVEYEADIVVSPENILFIMDGVLIASIPTVSIGSAILSRTPLQNWFQVNKIIHIMVQHDAGQVSHFRVHDIKVGRLAGVSSL